MAAPTQSSTTALTEKGVNRWRTRSSAKTDVKASCVETRMEEVDTGR
jgi:hypothetical protein